MMIIIATILLFIVKKLRVIDKRFSIYIDNLVPTTLS